MSKLLKSQEAPEVEQHEVDRAKREVYTHVAFKMIQATSLIAPSAGLARGLYALRLLICANDRVPIGLKRRCGTPA
jgi:hypothetical protein